MNSTRKTITVLSVILVGTLLSACDEKVSDEPNPPFTILKDTKDVDDLGDISIFCIDGVKYMVIPGIGITPKFKVLVDDSIRLEKCVNHTNTKK